MSKIGKIVKDTYKTKKESVMGKLGDAPFEDPMEPWSAKYNAPVKEEVEDLSEDSILYRYIRSKGYSPEHMDFAHRSAFARSNAFKTYKVMHQNRKKKPKGGIHDIKVVAKEEVVNEWDNTVKKKVKDLKKGKDLAKPTWKDKRAAEYQEKRDSKKLNEAGVGKLMNFIKSKGLDPTSMDGNHKKHYSRSSEYRVFKTVHPDLDKIRSEKKKKKVKRLDEISASGEGGADWNESTDQAMVKVKAVKKPHTHEVFHNKTGQVTGRYSSLSRAHRAADKKDNEYGGYAHSVRPIKESVDQADTITMDIPLLIRVLEYAREDAKDDMALHKVVENLINMRGKGVMSMAMYDKIVAIKESIKEADEAKYGKSYQAMVKRVGEKAKQKPVDIASLAARMQASYKKDEKKPLKELKKLPDNMDSDDHITREEVEEISELSKTTLKSYIKKRGETIHADKAESNVARNKAADLEYRGKQAQADTNHDEADNLHQRARKGATNVTKAAIKVAKKTNEEVVSEGIGGIEDSPLSATNSVKAMEACSCTPKQQAMKSARIIKSLYKRKLKESTYDWEKDDKGGKKATAKITVKGGTTMTGKPRDTVEIEPLLKTRPNGVKGLKPGV